MNLLSKIGIFGIFFFLLGFALFAGCSSNNNPSSPAAANIPLFTKTPTNNPTNSTTPTSSATLTATPSYTNSGTASPTNSPTHSPTPSPTNTTMNSPTITPTNSPTNSPTITPTNTATNTPTSTPSNSPTVTPCTTPMQFGPTPAATIGSEVGYVMVCQPVTLTSPIYVNSMAVDVAGSPTQMRVGIYTNQVISGGVSVQNYPDSLVTVSGYQDLTPGFNSYPVPSAYLSAVGGGTIYWLAYGGTDSTLTYNFYTNGATNAWGLAHYNGSAYVAPGFPAACSINDAGGAFDSPIIMLGCP